MSIRFNAEGGFRGDDSAPSTATLAIVGQITDPIDTSTAAGQRRAYQAMRSAGKFSGTIARAMALRARREANVVLPTQSRK